MDLIENIYRVTEQFPDGERFGLVTQMRRAAVSIASNLAEGAARKTTKEQLQSFYVSRGSISELDTQVEIAYRLRFIDGGQHQVFMNDLDELGRLLHGLMISKQP